MEALVLEEIAVPQKTFTAPLEKENVTKYQMTKAEEASVLKGLNDKRLGKVYLQEDVEREMEVLLWS